MRLLLLIALVCATPALAETASVQVGFGPFVGGGDISTAARVRHTSGYELSVERNFQILPGLAIGPRIELANAFVNVKSSSPGEKDIGTYDNRIVAAGFNLSQAVGNDGTLAQGLYLTGVAGKAFSKLTVDHSTDKTYKQSLYGNINGRYFGGELGAWIPLKGNFGVNLAFLSNIYYADQSAAPGTYDGDEVDSQGNLSLVQGQHEKDDGSLAPNVVMKTYAAKVGLSLGF